MTIEPEKLEPAAALLAAAKVFVDHYDRNTCTHEETHRGGLIWTICNECGQKWADDTGGFKPHVDPPEIAAARATILAMDRRASPPEQSPGLRAVMEGAADRADKKMATFRKAMNLASPPAPAVAVAEGPWLAARLKDSLPGEHDAWAKAQEAVDCGEDGPSVVLAFLTALAAAPEPPATRSEADFRNEGIEAVPEFLPIATYKLTALQADGWRVNGYSLIKEGRRGFIDHGGFVGWWFPEHALEATAIRSLKGGDQ